MKKCMFAGLVSSLLYCASSGIAANAGFSQPDGAVDALAVSLTSLEITGPSYVDEESQTNYICIAHYSDASSVDVTDLAEWSIVGSANTGVWIYDLWKAKAESEKYDIPLVYVWGGVTTCGYCTALDGYMARGVFQQWMGDRQVVMAYVKATESTTTDEKNFAKYGQNGTLTEFPFIAVYWKSKNPQPYNFTGRYTAGNEEQKFIDNIELYMGEYVSKPAPVARISGSLLTAASVISNSFSAVSVSFAGLTATKPVAVVNVPEPVMINSESFETGFGVWSASPGNGLNWSRDTGSTPSFSTGPAGASDGDYFIFTESTGNYSKSAAIESVFDFSSVTEPMLRFDYHMYGSSMGSLSVDVYDGIWHNNIWNRTGEQHTSTADAWTQAEVDLSAFTGMVTIRLRGVVGLGNRSDMAVDNIRLTDEFVLIQLSFADWELLEGIPVNLRAEDDSAAGDGIANLLKYACGLSAMEYTSSSNLLSIADGSNANVFAIRYFKSKTAENVLLEPIWAGTLSGPWMTTGFTDVLIDQDENREERKASIPLGESGFIRLRVTPVFFLNPPLPVSEVLYTQPAG